MKDSSLSLRLALVLLFATALGLDNPAQAQITPDATLGSENSTVTPNAVVQGDFADLIEGGAIRGGNLFHSFLEFNVDLGQRVYFANPVGIESILSRITGGNPSNIFGTLGVDGAADLFLINPNGIVFGENAALDIQGSFYASTAEAIPLGDGVYSATAPEQSSLLTVNPSALFSSYLTDASGDIENRGQLAAGENLTLTANRLDLQAQVAAGGDLTLLGNTVQIRDAVDTPFVGFAGGDLLVQGNEQIDIVALSHPNSGLYSYGDMVLRSPSPVGGDAHYWSGGDFRVETLNGTVGDLFSPRDPIVRTLGDVVIGEYIGTSLHILAGGSVTIRAATIAAPDAGTLGTDFLRETLTLSDSTQIQIDGGAQPTLDVRAGVLPAALGTPPLELLTGFDPATDSFADSYPTELPSSATITIGDVLMTAPNGLVLLTNQYQPNPQLADGTIQVASQVAPTAGIGGIFAGSILLGLPGGGTIFLDARDDITVIDSIITSISLEESGGGITLLAGGDLRFDSPTGKPTGAVTGSPAIASNDGGDIRVVATNLQMANGAQLNAATLGPGNAGDVTIEVRENASFQGTNLVNGTLTGVRSNVNGAQSTGSGGDIVLSARNLEVTDGAQFLASTQGLGNAGNVTLNITETARFDGVSATGINPSGAFSSIDASGQAQGGNVVLSAANLEVTNGAVLSASTFGTGNAGNVVLTIDETARFDGVNPITKLGPSGAFSSIEPGGQGRGGNVELSAANLEVTNGANLGASTFGIGNGGNVSLVITETARFDGVNPFTGLGPSGAVSSVELGGQGKGGNVELSAANLEVTNGASLAASTSGIGNAGNVILTITETARFDGIHPLTGLSPSGAFSSINPGGEGQGGNVELSAANLEVTHGAQLLASTFGIGNAGNVILTITETARFDGVNPLTGLNPSGIGSSVEQGGEGQGGNVELSATNLEVTNGAQIGASTFGVGNAGNVVLTIRGTARFDGVNPFTGQNPSGAFSSVEPGGLGQGGNVELSATNLEVTNGALLTASTFGVGNAGNVLLTIAETASFDGLNPFTGLNSSGVRSTVEPGAQGQGGNVELLATNLNVTNGAQIGASTFGVGDGGNVVLTIRDRARFDGVNLATGFQSGVGSAVLSGAIGNGGNVRLTANTLDVFNGATISSASFGIGNAGSVVLDVARQIRVDDATIATSALAASGGGIDIQAGSLVLRNDGDILTAVGSGAGSGGKIAIAADFVIALNDSDILAFSADGRGGAIDLSRSTFFGQNAAIAFGNLSRDDLLALDGNDRVDVNATGGIESGQISFGDASVVENSLANLESVIIDTTTLTAGSCIARSDESLGSFIVTGSGGLPQRPGDTSISSYPTGTVRTGAEPTATLQEPDGVYQLPDGRLVLSRACE